MTRRYVPLGALLCASLSCASLHAVILGQVDDFQDGTTMGWVHGSLASPNPPSNVADAGPGGVGDNALLNQATGVGGPGSRMTMLNQTQWSGDYIATGVTEISMMLRAAPGPFDILDMRVGFESGFGNRYVSDSFTLPSDGFWYEASFDISPAALTQVGGGMSATDVLSAVFEMRILSASTPSWQGDLSLANLFVDNIVAVPEPSVVPPLIFACALLALRRRTG